MSLISFYHYFCFHMKSLLTIFNFVNIDKGIVSDGYQNLDDKLIRELFESVL